MHRMGGPWVSLFLSAILFSLVKPGAGLVTGGVIARLLTRFGRLKAPWLEPRQEVVYVLDLEGGKKYVGRTDKRRLAKRIQSHVQGKGAAWTKKYRPLTDEPLEVRALEVGAEGGLEEDVVVKKYMLNYGVGNVRGGSYSQVLLPGSSLDVLVRELSHQLGWCLMCCQPGHWATSCPNLPFSLAKPPPRSASAVRKAGVGGSVERTLEVERRRGERRRMEVLPHMCEEDAEIFPLCQPPNESQGLQGNEILTLNGEDEEEDEEEEVLLAIEIEEEAQTERGHGEQKEGKRIRRSRRQKEGKVVASATRRQFNRTYLRVPYLEKEKAKALGGRWDRVIKQWFFICSDDTPSALDHQMRLFRRWLPGEEEEQPRRTRAPRKAAGL